MDQRFGDITEGSLIECMTLAKIQDALDKIEDHNEILYRTANRQESDPSNSYKFISQIYTIR